MKSVFLIVFLVLSITLDAQSVDSLNILIGSDWRTKGEWFGSDIVVMVSIPKLDTSGLSEKDKMELIYKKGLGERISFDKSGKLKYTYRLYCPVGETLYDIKEFKWENGKVWIDFRQFYYDKKQHSDGRNKEGKLWYKVETWSKDYIVLSKTSSN